jgi:hypothetical protein
VILCTCTPQIKTLIAPAGLATDPSCPTHGLTPSPARPFPVLKVCTCVPPAPWRNDGRAISDPDCPVHGQPAKVDAFCLCADFDRVTVERQINSDCPVHGSPPATVDEHFPNCTRDYADPACPEHGKWADRNPASTCICDRGPGGEILAQTDCPVHGYRHPPKIVPNDSGGWTVQGAPEVDTFGIATSEHGPSTQIPVPPSVPRQSGKTQASKTFLVQAGQPIPRSLRNEDADFDPETTVVDLADAVSVLNYLAWLLDVYADEADKRSRSAPTDHFIDSQSRPGWIGRALAYETAAAILRQHAGVLADSRGDAQP